MSVKLKEHLQINYDAGLDEILQQVMDAIEQGKKFMGKHQLVS